MNVLPSASKGDMRRLVALVSELAASPAQFRVRKPAWEGKRARGGPGSLDSGRKRGLGGIFRRKAESGVANERAGAPMPRGEKDEGRTHVVLSTFGGHDAAFGMQGWRGFLETLSHAGVDVSRSAAPCRLAPANVSQPRQVYFIPAFFIPPETVLGLPEVDAAFSWNGGWSVVVRVGHAARADGELDRPMEGLKLDPMLDRPFIDGVSLSIHQALRRHLLTMRGPLTGQTVHGGDQPMVLYALRHGATLGLEQVRGEDEQFRDGA